jgi:mRNA interferase RelE/StbE
MKNYFIEISPAAERDLKKLKNKISNFNKLISVIDDLSTEPKPYGVRKISGFKNTFRIRFFVYRIIYDVLDRDNRLIILRIIKRNESTYKF